MGLPVLELAPDIIKAGNQVAPVIKRITTSSVWDDDDEDSGKGKVTDSIGFKAALGVLIPVVVCAIIITCLASHRRRRQAARPPPAAWEQRRSGIVPRVRQVHVPSIPQREEARRSTGRRNPLQHVTYSDRDLPVPPTPPPPPPPAYMKEPPPPYQASSTMAGDDRNV